jgi:hypothetical protein
MLRLSVVLTTIGRPIAFSCFLDHLVHCAGLESTELILVDQDPERKCSQLLSERSLNIPWRAMTSPPGASAGRAAGAAIARGDILAVPDDECWYEPEVVVRVLKHFAADPALVALSGRLVTPAGRDTVLRWASRSGRITRRNWWRRSIATTLFFRQTAVMHVGSFDPQLGTGSRGWFQAGEESDLLLRLIATGGRARYDRSLVIVRDEAVGPPSRTLITKTLGYGCGQGYVWRRHRLSRSQMAYLVFRKLVAAMLHTAGGKIMLAKADVAFARGWLAGYRGRPPKSFIPLTPLPEAAEGV